MPNWGKYPGPGNIAEYLANITDPELKPGSPSSQGRIVTFAESNGTQKSKRDVIHLARKKQATLLAYVSKGSADGFKKKNTVTGGHKRNFRHSTPCRTFSSSGGPWARLGLVTGGAQPQPSCGCWNVWLVREMIHCKGRSVSIHKALWVAAFWLCASLFERFTMCADGSFGLRLFVSRCLLPKLHVGIGRLFAAAMSQWLGGQSVVFFLLLEGTFVDDLVQLHSCLLFITHTFRERRRFALVLAGKAGRFFNPGLRMRESAVCYSWLQL